MAERVAERLDGDERLLVEAGTGTGKTLAYLVPALLSGRKVVVSHRHEDPAGSDRHASTCRCCERGRCRRRFDVRRC